MTPDLPVEKIAAILPRLSSPHDGEVVASARAIDRILKSSKSDWHVLTKAFTAGASGAVTSPPSEQPHARASRPRWHDTPYALRENLLEALAHKSWLSSWERSFLDSIKAQLPRRELSERQTAVVDRLLARAFPYGGAQW